MRHRARRDEGASAVEFALVSMLLVLLLFGIIQFGWLFWQWLELTHAAREGARWASLRHPTGTLSELTTVDTVDDTTVKGRVWLAAPGLRDGLGDSDIEVSVDNVTVQTTDEQDLVGRPVSVTVYYDIPLFIPLNLFDSENRFDSSATAWRLSSSATQRIE